MKWATLILLITVQFSLAQKQNAYLSTSVEQALSASLSASATQEIPFELINGMILVEAQIDHQRGIFILDTGAPTLVLNVPRKTEAGSENAQSCSGTFSVGESTTRHFSWAGMTKYQIHSLTANLTHLEAATGKRIKGLIGFQLFKDQEILIDYDRQRIFLFGPDANPLHQTLPPVLTASLNFQDHLPIVELTLGKTPLRFGLDTGSESNLIDACALSELKGISIDTINEEFLQGLDQKLHRVPVVEITGMELEKTPLAPSPFLVTDLCHLKAGSNVEISGLLGFDFFRQTKVSFNFRKREIYFWEWEGSL